MKEFLEDKDLKNLLLEFNEKLKHQIESLMFQEPAEKQDRVATYCAIQTYLIAQKMLVKEQIRRSRESLEDLLE